MVEAFTTPSEADENPQLAAHLQLWEAASSNTAADHPTTPYSVDPEVIGSRGLDPLEYGDDGKVYFDC
jgi:hypothetical protein